jgi:hypothetical protein
MNMCDEGTNHHRSRVRLLGLICVPLALCALTLRAQVVNDAAPSPAVQPPSPAVQPPSPAVQPPSPAVQPASPAAQPVSPAVQPASPAAQPASLAPEGKSYTCPCDSPCEGSITCKNGCYAFCEENPEGSGRHVCIKGCASAAFAAEAGATLDPLKKYASVYLSIPRNGVVPLVESLYGTQLSDTQRLSLQSDAATPITIRLRDADMAAVLHALRLRENSSKAGKTP